MNKNTELSNVGKNVEDHIVKQVERLNPKDKEALKNKLKNAASGTVDPNDDKEDDMDDNNQSAQKKKGVSDALGLEESLLKMFKKDLGE